MSRSSRADSDRLRALRAELDRYAFGVHQFSRPAVLLDSDLPEGLAAVYRLFNGCELFHQTLVLLPSTELERGQDRLWVGEVCGDRLFVALPSGQLWRIDADSGDVLREGSAFDRWLRGFVDAEGVLYTPDGEFREEIFDEDGEYLADIVVKRERSILKRDRRAPAPRWRLSRALAELGDMVAARAELEEAVSVWPEFAWAWFDLARMSEELDGDVGAAIAEMEEAATAAEALVSAFAPLMWAHVARLAHLCADEERRARAAGRASGLDQGFARSQLGGAEEELAAGEFDSARELAELAQAVTPRDLAVIDLLKRLEEASPE